ncbi:SMP-30/gluconolactonase/LRE family protein [Reichenbachiella carrageenanivorans]|uniref:SMP-30/gluconolactonase/LRE family protein n=1 Tax=Reichenbachiella carrageenanivorans TaxID=2979869 RepID=A0ABY6CYF6_9BACT|nr:SMP-30/gluconolactonase/LRE family protein [Reichenbachiella carrageenanivorans]UXX78956.1 SMP-30/gluconolactonase/LRE family protein [Reichenbachiella carrageenanivorans]
MKLHHAICLFGLGYALVACQTKSESSTSPTAEPAIPEWEAGLFVEMENELGEGAIWNHETGEFWHIDIESKQFFTTDVKTKQQKTYGVEQRIGTIVPNTLGQAVVALQDGIYTYDFMSKTKKLIASPEDTIANIRFNDGKCDPAGRFWVGSMGLDQKAYRASLYSIDHGVATQQLDSMTISNGIVWTSDKKTMYYINTPDENVKAFDYDEATGQISNERIVIEIGGIGYPDGMAIDAEDMLWIALWNGNMVGRYNPQTGALIGKVNVPAHNITSCAFVGADLDSLVITSARVDMNADEKAKYPLAGSLFVAVPGVKGVKSNFYEADSVIN